jgi:RNA polymerase sigma-70 factor (ECF subfamily)
MRQGGSAPGCEIFDWLRTGVHGIHLEEMLGLAPVNPRFDPQRSLATNSNAAAGVGHPDVSGARCITLSRQGLVDALMLTGRGDQAAFSRVYAATSVKLFGIILRILGRRDLALDVLQEVYIRVWQHAGEFNPAVNSPIAWLVTIARSCALDETRRKMTRSLDDCPEPCLASNDESTFADHESNEDHLRLLACLDRLEPDRREVVVLAYHYGMTREEIAHRTNRPVATVQAWLRQSLAQIKDGLGQ